MDGALSTGDLELLRKDFSANPAYRLVQNAVTQVALDDVAINREIVNSSEKICWPSLKPQSQTPATIAPSRKVLGRYIGK